MSTHSDTFLGEILVKLGYCTKQQIEEAKSAMNGSRRLGESLVQLGYIRQCQLHEALTYQEVQRTQIDRTRAHAFVAEQRNSLIKDLRSLTSDIQALTIKIRATTGS